MTEKFFKQFDEITAPPSAVEKAVAAAQSVEPSVQLAAPKKRRRLWIGAAAAALVIAAVLGVILIPRGGNPDSMGSRFTITANAAAHGDRFGSNVISAFMCTTPLENTWEPDQKGNYLLYFIVDTLHIEGRDIDSVSVRTDVKDMAFLIDPLPPMENGLTFDDLNALDSWDRMEDLFDGSDEFYLARQKEKSKYTDLSLNGSDQSEEELREAADGAIMCSSFTYRNTDHDDPVMMDNSMMVVMTLTRSDDEMTRLLDECGDLQEQRQRICDEWMEKMPEEENGFDEWYAGLDEKTEEIDEKLEALTVEILKHVLDGELTVGVTFTDGATESKRLKLGTAITDNEYGMLWLTVSEESHEE